MTYSPVSKTDAPVTESSELSQAEEQFTMADVPLLSRVGYWSMLVVLIGTICILGTTSFPLFLWCGDIDNHVIRQIVVSGWTARSITLAALVIRWAVAAQATVAASMLAALALYRAHIDLPDRAAASILRYAGGLHYLILPLFRGFRQRKGTRAICVKPKAVNISVAFLDIVGGNGNKYLEIGGKIGLSDGADANNQYLQNQSSIGRINCTIPLPHYDSCVRHEDDPDGYACTPEWPVSLCPIYFSDFRADLKLQGGVLTDQGEGESFRLSPARPIW